MENLVERIPDQLWIRGVSQSYVGLECGHPMTVIRIVGR